MLSTLPEAEDHRAAPLALQQIGQFEVDLITHPAAGEQEQVEDRRCPQILAQFHLSQKAADLAPLQSLRWQGLAVKPLVLQPPPLCAGHWGLRSEGRCSVCPHPPLCAGHWGGYRQRHCTHKPPAYAQRTGADSVAVLHNK